MSRCATARLGRGASFWMRGMALGLWLVAGFLLLADLSADPPGDIDHSAGIIFDPPSKCQAARNRVLFGAWRTDEWTPYLHGALHTLVQTAVFRIAGVSLVTMRLPGALMLWAAVALFGAVAARGRHGLAAVLAIGLGGINAILLAYGRSGLLEPQLVFWVALSAWALDRAWRAPEGAERIIGAWLFLAGSAAAAAFWTKGTAAPYLLAATAVVLIIPPGRRRTGVWFLIPLLLALGAYAGPFWWHNRAFFEREAAHWIGRASQTGLWERWLRQPLFHQLGRLRWIPVLAFVAIPLTWRRYRNRQDTPAGLRVLGLALVLASQAVACMDYRPLRYSFPVYAMSIPLAAWLIARTLVWAWNPHPRDLGVSPAWRTAVLGIVGWLFLTFALAFGAVYPWARSVRILSALSLNGRHVLAGILAGIGIGATHLWGRRAQAWLGQRSIRFRMGLVCAVWGCVLATAGLGQAREIRIRMYAREHQMFHFSRRLGERYREAIFAGPSPAFAVMGNRHQARKVTEYGINLPALSDPALTHLLLPGTWRHHRMLYEREYPEVWARASPVEWIVISGISHALYALDRKPLAARIADGRVEVSNPDSHTPAWFCLAWPASIGETIHGVSHELLPETGWSQAAPEREPWFFPRDAWQRLDPPDEGVRSVSRVDPVAWDQRAWAVGWTRRRTGRVREGRASWMIERDAPIQVLGLRLRGAPDRLERVQVSWTPESGAVMQEELSIPHLASDRYEVFFWAVPRAAQASRGRLSVEVSGGSAVWIDAVLLATGSDLARARIEAP